MNIVKMEKLLQKYFVLIITLVLVILAILMRCYLGQSVRVRKYNITQYIVKSELEFEYQITKLATEEDPIVSGWCIERGRSYYFYNYGWGRGDYAAYNNIHYGCIIGDEVYEFATRLNEPANPQFDDDGIDYHYYGFNAYIPDDMFDLYQKGNKCIVMRSPNGEAYLVEVEV